MNTLTANAKKMHAIAMNNYKMQNAQNGQNGHYAKKVVEDEVLTEAFTYITKVCKNDIWKAILEGFNNWLKVDNETFDIINTNLEMFRISTYLLDDVQDEAEQRRGITAAHHLYGIPCTLNALYYVSAMSARNILNLKHERAIYIYKDRLSETCKSRQQMLEWRETNNCPTEEEYFEMAIKKMMSNILVGVELMQLSNDTNQKFTKLVNALSLFMQLRIDYDNLKPNNNEEECCSDVQYGNFSFPIIHAIQNNPTKKEQLTLMLRQHTNEPEVLQYFVKLLEECGSFDYTRDKMQELKDEILTEIRKLGGNRSMEIFVKEKLLVPE